MERKDISLALLTLGLWIDRAGKNGVSEKTLKSFKASYLRINWWILKNPTFSQSPVLTEEAWQEILRKVQTISPSFLPCHNVSSDNPSQPCNSHSNSCRCMELLGAVQEVEHCV